MSMIHSHLRIPWRIPSYLLVSKHVTANQSINRNEQIMGEAARRRSSKFVKKKGTPWPAGSIYASSFSYSSTKFSLCDSCLHFFDSHNCDLSSIIGKQVGVMVSVPHANRFSLCARRLTSVLALLMAALALQTFGIAQTSTSDATQTSPATEVQATPASTGEETVAVVPAQPDAT